MMRYDFSKRLTKKTGKPWCLMLPIALLYNSDLTATELRILSCLLDHRGPKGCFPGYATIAFETNISDRTVRRCIKALRRKGWINWEIRKKQDGSYSSHLYDLTALYERVKCLSYPTPITVHR